METESGFIVTPQLDTEESGAELLHRSERGFAEIWRVEKFGQFVVLKCLKEDLRGDPIYEALLRKEFEIGYSLNHPSICRTWHFREHPTFGKCIEMEWVDGIPLSERFAGGKPDEELFRKIAGELCDAVAYLHSRQIVHRDIKPANILITHNGDNVKLIDFGLADSDRSAILKMQAGTPSHIAPEVLAGRDADFRSDIWSVGKVLSELTSHHRRALRRCLAENPENRFQHIGDAKKALMEKSKALPFLIACLVVAALIAAVILYRGVGPWSPASGPATIEATVDSAAAPVAASDSAPAPDGNSAVSSEVLPADGATAPPVPTTRPRASDKPATNGSQDVSKEDIDRLMQTASDLFE